MGVISEVLTSMTVNTTVFLHVMSIYMVDWYRRFGGNCSCTLKMKAEDCFETSVPIYRISRCHIPEVHVDFELYRSTPALFNVQLICHLIKKCKIV
jgi:hypothetical protein